MLARRLAHRVFKVAYILLFGLLALALLVIGYVVAQAWWHTTHHRYYQPDSGYYHGSVHAFFFGTEDDVYSFHFEGETAPRWRWAYSTNFTYQSLHFEWHRFDSQADLSEDNGKLRLPSLAYESSRGTGVLTRAVLAEWLLGTTNGTPEAKQSVDAVFGFIEGAGRGTLPAPNHHGHYFEQPVRGRIQHFQLGFGIGGVVYIWVGIWLLLVVITARRFWRRHRETPEKPATSVIGLERGDS
jgi:hypothetical protein